MFKCKQDCGGSVINGLVVSVADCLMLCTVGAASSSLPLSCQNSFVSLLCCFVCSFIYVPVLLCLSQTCYLAFSFVAEYSYSSWYSVLQIQFYSNAKHAFLLVFIAFFQKNIYLFSKFLNLRMFQLDLILRIVTYFTVFKLFFL